MVRDPETIQAEIERARTGLAVAVDELSTRLDPRRAIDQGRRRLQALWDEPRIKYPAMVLVAGITYLYLRKAFK